MIPREPENLSSRSLSRRAFTLRLTGGVTLAMAGCGPREAAPATDPVAVDSIDVIYPTPSSYDPVDNNKQYEVMLLDLVHSRLAYADTETNRLVPGLATSWTRSQDARTWTFTLAEACIPDRNALTADDVVFSLGLYTDERFKSSLRGNLVIGGSTVLAKADGPRTVVFTAADPAPHLDWILAGIMILPRKVYGPIAGSPETWRETLGEAARPEHVQGYGPYRLVSRDNREIVLERNVCFGKDSEGNPLPHIGSIRFTLIDNPAAAKLRFQEDERFAFRTPDPVELKGYRKDPAFQVIKLGLGGWTTFFWANQNKDARNVPPGKLALFQSVEFRRALGHAIDRRSIAQKAFLGEADPMYGPFSPAFPWCSPEGELKAETPAYDPGLARKGLEAVGLKRGQGGFYEYREGNTWRPLTMPIYTTPSPGDVRKIMVEVIAAQLRAVGIDASVEVIPFNDAVARILKSKDYTSMMMFLEGQSHPSLAGELIQSFSRMHFHSCSQPTPLTEWEAQCDRLFRDYSSATDPKAADEALAEIQRVWTKAQPFTYLVCPTSSLVVRSKYRIEGMAINGRIGHPALSRPVVERLRVARYPR